MFIFSECPRFVDIAQRWTTMPYDRRPKPIGRIDATGVSLSGTTLHIERQNGDIPDITVNLSALSAAGVDVQTFTASGTWTKPAGAVLVDLYLVGGGGGGGGGRSGAAGSARGGGGGGSAAAVARYRILAAAVDATVTVTVGAGGVGGTGSVAAANGGSGADGGETKFGTLFIGHGGSGANGGTTSSGSGGSTVVNGYGRGTDGLTRTLGNPDTPGSTSAGVYGEGLCGGNGGLSPTSASSGTDLGTAIALVLPGAGGGGGGISSGNVTNTGARGSRLLFQKGPIGSLTQFWPDYSGLTSGAAGSNLHGDLGAGGGGAGGDASSVAVGTTGGAGGSPGGGGGGGGAGLAGTGSGAGGAGGDGVVVVTTYF